MPLHQRPQKESPKNTYKNNPQGKWARGKGNDSCSGKPEEKSIDLQVETCANLIIPKTKKSTRSKDLTIQEVATENLATKGKLNMDLPHSDYFLNNLSRHKIKIYGFDRDFHKTMSGFKGSMAPFLCDPRITIVSHLLKKDDVTICDAAKWAKFYSVIPDGDLSRYIKYLTTLMLTDTESESVSCNDPDCAAHFKTQLEKSEVVDVNDILIEQIQFEKQHPQPKQQKALESSQSTTLTKRSAPISTIDKTLKKRYIENVNSITLNETIPTKEKIDKLGVLYDNLCKLHPAEELEFIFLASCKLSDKMNESLKKHAETEKLYQDITKIDDSRFNPETLKQKQQNIKKTKKRIAKTQAEQIETEKKRVKLLKEQVQAKELEAKLQRLERGESVISSEKPRTDFGTERGNVLEIMREPQVKKKQTPKYDDMYDF
jgi:hypothetical protein